MTWTAPIGTLSQKINFIIRIFLIILYFVHWYYGAILFPSKYKSYFEKIWKKERVSAYSSDLSECRGFLAGILTILILIRHPSPSTIVLSIIWVFLIALFNLLSKTNSLFKTRHIILDLNVIAPEIAASDYDDTTYMYKPYLHINYFVRRKAVILEENGIQQMAIEAYYYTLIAEYEKWKEKKDFQKRAKEEEEKRKKEKEVEKTEAEEKRAKEITKFSENVLAIIEQKKLTSKIN